MGFPICDLSCLWKHRNKFGCFELFLGASTTITAPPSPSKEAAILHPYSLLGGLLIRVEEMTRSLDLGIIARDEFPETSHTGQIWQSVHRQVMHKTTPLNR